MASTVIRVSLYIQVVSTTASNLPAVPPAHSRRAAAPAAARLPRLPRRGAPGPAAGAADQRRGERLAGPRRGRVPRGADLRHLPGDRHHGAAGEY